MVEQRLRHQRTGVKAHRAPRDEIAAAHRDEIGRAGPGADEMHGHAIVSHGNGAGRHAIRDARSEQPAAWPRHRERRGLRYRRHTLCRSRARSDRVMTRSATRTRSRHRHEGELQAAPLGADANAGFAALACFGHDQRQVPGFDIATRTTPRSAPPRCSSASRSSAAPDPRDDHSGFLTRHCVIGIAGRQPRHRTDLTARATSRRTNSPPIAWNKAASRASVSNDTALATSRPPGFNACHAVSNTASSPKPPPMKTASGAGRPSQRLRCISHDDAQVGCAERGGVARRSRGSVLAFLDADRLQRRMPQAAIRSQSTPRQARYPTAARPVAAPAPTA